MKAEKIPPAGLRRRLAKVLVASLAAVALLVAMAWMVGAFSFRTNLSRTASLISALPDVAENGQYVAAVWADFDDTPPDVDGKIRLKRSPVSGDFFWGEHKAVFDPASGGNGLEAKLALGSTSPYTDAHVVWLKGTANVPTQIHYSMCDISSSGMPQDCAISEQIETVAGSNNIRQPDIAVDSSGTPHAVWVNEELSTVRYGVRVGANNWTIESVPSAGNGSAPTVAFGNGYAHVAWVQDNVDPTPDSIVYQRRSKGSGTWDEKQEFAGGLGKAGSPSIAVSGSNVMLVWDAEIVSGKYGVIYNYSSNSGDGWQLSGSDWRAVPTGGENTSLDRVRRTSSEGASTYTERLQPDVTLEFTNTNTYAHVVWHEQVAPGGEGSERYDVFYSSADFSKLDYSTTCGSSDCWVTPSNVTSSTKAIDSGIDSAAAAIAVGQALTHTVYMEKRGSVWDAFYNGQLDGSGGPRYLPIIMKNSS